jgi:acyl-CoA thioester hydrolase
MHETPLDREKTRTTTELRVRFCDTDLMGIVHHANYFAYFEAGRVEWLRRRGVEYTSWASHGIHLPVVEATIRYRQPARFDDVIVVETMLSELRVASLRYEYRIERGGLLLCEGMTRLACVDERHAVKRLTEEMVKVLTAGEV